MAQRNHVLDWGLHPPWEGAILRGKGAPVVKYIATLYRGSCAKTAEPIEMPFGI